VILADTSIWVDHLRKGDPHLAALLNRNQVLMHDFVIGEIACGHLANRTLTLELLQNLPMASLADISEVTRFIEAFSLFGKGIGYVDIHLLASVVLGGDTTLWSRDKRLISVAQSLGVAYSSANAH
jgi:predicted nucleic acid-binding protein